VIISASCSASQGITKGTKMHHRNTPQGRC